jgi:hypothetical protein
MLKSHYLLNSDSKSTQLILKIKTQLPECAQFTDIKSIKATRGTRWTKITNEMNEALINLDTGHR